MVSDEEARGRWTTSVNTSVEAVRPIAVHTNTPRLSMDTESTPLIHDQSSPDDYISARPSSFIQSPRTGTREYKPSIRNRISLYVGQLFSFIVSSFCLILVVGWALFASIPALFRDSRTEREVFEWDDHAKYRNERNTCDVRYYAREAGCDIVDEEVETEDGFLLR
jgi:hypothetical protein